MRFSGPFLDKLAELDESAEARIWEKLELVESFPGVGSSLLEPLLVRAFGRGCLKVSAVGYDVIYERSGEGDEDDRGNGEGDETVSVLGIIKQRRIRQAPEMGQGRFALKSNLSKAVTQRGAAPGR